MNVDSIIVGGGIMGMMTALELAREGLSVCLVERGQLGCESTWAGGGILSPLYPWTEPEPMHELYLWSGKVYAGLSQTIKSETGVDIEWHVSGMVILDSDQASQCEAWCKDYHVDVEFIEPARINELFNIEYQNEREAIYLPAVTQLRNPRLIQGLKNLLQKMNVTIKEACPVEEFTIKDGRVQSIKTRDGVLYARDYVVTAGAWSKELLADTVGLDIKPMRGQMLCYRTQGPMIKQIILRDGVYLIPRQDDLLLVGSTVEDVGFDRGITQEAKQELHKALVKLLPAYKSQQSLKQWSGLRPGSDRRLPYIGPCPEVENLYINAGHFRNGILAAPASARMIREMIRGDVSIFDPTPFQLVEKACSS